MADKSYKVKEVARLSGVTVRALHHYDATGLLRPVRTSAGYRAYTTDDLLRLQQILVHREAGLPLEAIRAMLDDPSFDRKAALLRQRDELARRAQQVRAMIRAIDAALEAMEGDEDVNERDIFNGFDPSAHQDEVKHRWGNTDAYRHSAHRTKSYSEEDWRRLRSEFDTIMRELAKVMADAGSPSGDLAMSLAERHRLHIDRWYYPCSPGMHRGLAAMYDSDPRFAETFDKHAKGLSTFLRQAIEANSGQSETEE